MGKGTITAGGTAGLYSVTLELARERITAKIAKMTADIAVLTAKIAQIQAQIDAVQAQMDTLAAQIAIYEADRVKYQKEYCAAVGSMVTLISTKETYDRQKNMAVLQQKALTARIAYLNRAVPADPSVSAWCADKTENLTGTVGTIEIPGERGSVLIQPGYGGNATYSKTRDGRLQPSIAGEPSAVFYNLAMLPGWQKWKPTYRLGAITAINKTAHTCSVTLDAAASSAQSLDINQGTALTGVPIEYMSCNSAAFSVGDRVVVQFINQSFAAPKVIGFEKNPKPCGAYLVLLTAHATYTRTALVWNMETGAIATEAETGFVSPIAVTDSKWLTWWNAQTLDATAKSAFGAITVRSQFEYDLNPHAPAQYKELPTQFPEIVPGGIDHCTTTGDNPYVPDSYAYHFENYGGFPADPTSWGLDIPPQLFVPTILCTLPDSGETFYFRNQKESVTASQTDSVESFSTPYGALHSMTTYGWSIWHDIGPAEYEYYGLARKYHYSMNYSGYQPTLTSKQGARAVCLICMHYFTPVTCHYYYNLGVYSDITYTPAAARQYHTHATVLFYKDGYKNTAIIPEGRNTDFEAACEAVMEKFYTVNSLADNAIERVTLLAEIVDSYSA